MAKRKLTKAVTLLGEVQDKLNEVKGLLSDYEVSVPEATILVTFGIKELANEFKVPLTCSPKDETTGYFNAFFITRGVRFMCYMIPERERMYYEEVE